MPSGKWDVLIAMVVSMAAKQECGCVNIAFSSLEDRCMSCIAREVMRQAGQPLTLLEESTLLGPIKKFNSEKKPEPAAPGGGSNMRSGGRSRPSN